MKAQQVKVIMMQQMIARSLFTACVAIMIVYAAFLASMMFYATETNSFNRQITEATGALSDLEFEYISLKQSVTMEKARQLGFNEVETPVFVRVDSSVAVSVR